MVDPRKARHLLSLFRRYREYLRDLAARGDDALRSDFAVMGGVQHYLLLAIESAILHGSIGDLDRFVELLRERFRSDLVDDDR